MEGVDAMDVSASDSEVEGSSSVPEEASVAIGGAERVVTLLFRACGGTNEISFSLTWMAELIFRFGGSLFRFGGGRKTD